MTSLAPAFVATGNHMITAPSASVRPSAAGDGKPIGIVALAGTVDVYCRTPEQARDIAQHFIEVAGLMEKRIREAAGAPENGTAAGDLRTKEPM